MNFSFSRIHLGLGGLLAAVALLVLSPGASAATINVPGDEPTIQDAVDRANPGDTIVVKGRSRSYFENVVVTTNRLTIVGRNRNGREAVVDGTSPGGGTDGLTFDVDADKFTLENMRSLHGNGIDCTGQNCKFVDVIVNMSDQGGDCLEIDGGGAAVKRSRLAGCDDNAIDIDGNRLKIRNNVVIQGDNRCLDLSGDDGLVSGNWIRNCEDGEGIEYFGDDGVFRDNIVRSTDNESLNIDGDRNLVEANRASASDDSSGCFNIDGIRARVRHNQSFACDGGFEIDGENLKVIGNRSTGNSDDAGFDIDCFDEGGGASLAEACEQTVIRGNLSGGNADDDDGFDISDSSTDGGLSIINNVSRNNNDGGYELFVDNSRFVGNVSRRDGAEGNEPGFDLFDGDGNVLKDNKAVNTGDDGFQISGGNRNRLLGNMVKFSNLDGIHIESGNKNVIRGSRTFLNSADGIENDGDDTRVVGNESFDNRRDCANDGTIAVNRRNRCADGSDFEKSGTVDRVRPRRG